MISGGDDSDLITTIYLLMVILEVEVGEQCRVGGRERR